MNDSPLKRLIDELSKLPGVGKRSAERLAMHILRMDAREASALARAIDDVKARVRPCSKCHQLSENDPCSICADPKRDSATVCVVENSSDVWAFEKSGEYRGIYHVLGGKMSPLKGIDAEDLTIQSLVDRIRQGGIDEVIIATNPDVEGDTTALYIERELEPLNVSISRIGLGLPVGGSLEFADHRTLNKALQTRRKLND
jgi:recombination protein RecR